jgi:hypothetical protein
VICKAHKMIKIFAFAVFTGWLSLVGVGLVNVSISLYDPHSRRWERDNLLYNECHETRYMKLYPAECSYIFMHPPSVMRSVMRYLLEILHEVDKCGVSCSELFTYTNIFKFAIFNSLIGMKNLPSLVNTIKSKYNDYKVIQIMRKRT